MTFPWEENNYREEYVRKQRKRLNRRRKARGLEPFTDAHFQSMRIADGKTLCSCGCGKRHKRSPEGHRKERVENQKQHYMESGHPPWYGEYLKTEHWQRFKERYRKSGLLRACLICHRRPYELHHTTYERLGDEAITDVVPLCRAHHLQSHAIERVGIPLEEAHLVVLRKFSSKTAAP